MLIVTIVINIFFLKMQTKQNSNMILAVSTVQQPTCSPDMRIDHQLRIKRWWWIQPVCRESVSLRVHQTELGFARFAAAGGPASMESRPAVCNAERRGGHQTAGDSLRAVCWTPAPPPWRQTLVSLWCQMETTATASHLFPRVTTLSADVSGYICIPRLIYGCIRANYGDCQNVHFVTGTVGGA